MIGIDLVFSYYIDVFVDVLPPSLDPRLEWRNYVEKSN